MTSIFSFLFIALSILLAHVLPSLAAEQWVSSIRTSNQWAVFPCTDYWITNVCGTDKAYSDPGTLPPVISVGDTVTYKNAKGESKFFTVRNIQFFAYEEDVDFKYGGQRLTARKGDTSCSLFDVSDRSQTRASQYPSKIVIKGCYPIAAGGDKTRDDAACLDYVDLSESQRLSLAYGYLEGVQAALDKELTDILVPPSNPQHPLWWVLPTGLPDNPSVGLAQKLEQHCRSGNSQHERLLDAFLSIAHQKSGSPALGISVDKKKTDPWKNILGGKETSVSCSAYSASPVATRQAMIYGYYLGTEALRIALKSSVDIGIVWPSKLSPQAVRIDVDKRCQKDKAARLRSVLWLTTAELGIQNP